jgi:tryptophan synthase alpha subunit
MEANGLDGLIVPDCPLDEPEFGLPEVAVRHGLAFVPLIAPTTSLERAHSLSSATSSPFVYAVLRLGVTGRKTEIPETLLHRLGQLRSATQKVVAAGFGIGHRSQIESISGYADCAIVGSALLAAYDSAQRAGSDGVEAVAQLISQLKGGG